ncbi:hypothetical protein D3C72_1754430 [compost metagenome]
MGPLAALDQFRLQPDGLGRSRAQTGQVGADQRAHPHAYRFRAAGVAAGIFLDQALQQADGEGDTRRLHRLQVARGQQARPVRALQGGGHQGPRIAQGVSPGLARQRHAVGAVKQIGHGGNRGGDVHHLAAAHHDHAGAVDRRRAPDAAHQQRLRQIGRQQAVLIHGVSSIHALHAAFVWVQGSLGDFIYHVQYNDLQSNMLE